MSGALHRTTAAVIVVAAVAAGCGGASDAPQRPTSSSTPPPPPPAEAQEAPEVRAESVPGRVVSLAGGKPKGAVVDAASKTLAVALRSPDRLALVDTRSGKVRTVPVPGAARHLAIGRPGELLVMGENTDVLARVSLPGGEVVGKVKVGRQPHDAARVGDTLFVANEFGRSVGVVRDGEMVRELGGLVQPGGLAATRGRVAVVDVRANELHVFDAASLRRVAVLPAGDGPSHVRAIGDGRVVVADTRGNAVRTYDVTGKPRQLSTMQLSGRPYGLATDMRRGVAYVTLSTSNQVVQFDIRPDGSLVRRTTLPTVQQPNSVAVDASTGTVYVIGKADSQIQVLEAGAFAG